MYAAPESARPLCRAGLREGCLVRVPWIAIAALLLAGPAFAELVLPRPDQAFRGKIAPTRDHAVPDWPQAVKAPAGAPNIVLILLDDVGYAAAGTFGGPAATPELDRLAAGGVRYNNFNT